MNQQIGMIGLGRMGGNMARRMARAGLRVVAWDRAAGPRAGIAAEERVQVCDTLPLWGLLQENKELRMVLFSPFYPAPRRKAIARSIGESLGLSKSTLDFVNLLIERGRMDHFPAVVKSYEGLCDEVSNRLRASLASAEKLPPQLVGEIKTQMESSTGKEVILSTLEDPTLIGGVVTKIGNIIYDGSLKTQLLKAKENLYNE